MAENHDWTANSSLHTSENENGDRLEASGADEGAVGQQPARQARGIRRANSWDSIFGNAKKRGLEGWYPPPHKPWDDAGLNNETLVIGSSDMDDIGSSRPRHGYNRIFPSAASAKKEKDYQLSSISLPIDTPRASADVRSVKAPSTSLHSRKSSLGVASNNRTPSSGIHDAHLGIIIRRTENINMFDNYSSDPGWMSETSSCVDSDSEDDSLDERIRHPTKYFQELDSLESKVLENSAFQFYTDGTSYKPFDSHTYFRVPYAGTTPLRKWNETHVKRFFSEVLSEANASILSPLTSDHYNAHHMLDIAIENLFHLIECRNIILWVVESVEAMETASYCGPLISMLVIDKTRDDVARLLPIECSKIKQLAGAFETCLSEVLSLHPSTPLFDNGIITFANGVSEACRNFLSELDLAIPFKHVTEIWRCAVHVLDMAVLSYAGAHTQFFGITKVKSITLPGPFLEAQYLVFRRRSFLCLGEFLGGQEAWVLERYHPDAPQVGLPQLYLSTNATTFGDIWGPMWKSCALVNGQADHDQILRYNVGNGVILPWNRPLLDSQDSVNIGKDEMFCHWISDNDSGDVGNLVKSSGQALHPDNILLIGASMRLQYNPRCRSSTDEIKQRLRDSGSLSEPGTMQNTRIVDSEAVQIQVSLPYVNFGLQRIYKRRGRTWKEVVIEDWKNNPESRKVRILEYKFGVEVSSCTHSARRRRLITLLGSNTMVNHLRNGSLRWNSADCREEFFAALQSTDYKAFRRLYKARTDWQPDLGKAITHCLDGLAETGTNERGLDLLWVPDSNPGLRVNIRSREHSWVGFLKDTEECCTMAVLEDKCLELPDLTRVRRCRNRQFGSRPAIDSMSGQLLEMSVLETSFILNQKSVPKSMCPIPCHGPNGSTPRHEYLWRTSLLEDGEKFCFGKNGQLKSITSLGNGQILANWKQPWDILTPLKEKVLGSYFDSSHEMKHREYVWEEKGGPGPIYVLIISSVPEKTTASFTTSDRASTHYGRQYSWNTSESARPRGFGPRSNSTGTTSNELREIMNRWIRGDLSSITEVDQSVFAEAIAALVAAIPSPIENNRGEIER